jgi:hypothetical protein
MPSRSYNRNSPLDPADGLPKSIEAEQFVLGAVLTDSPNSLRIIRSLLEANDFFLDKHRLVYQRALELHDRGQAVNRLTLAEELERHGELKRLGGRSFVNSLDDGLPQIIDPVSYARIVKEKAVRRHIICFGDGIAKRAFSPADTNEILLASAGESLRQLQAESGQQPEAPPAVPQWPDPIAEEGFHGVAGQLVRTLEPHTESDRNALLVQFLVGWGNLTGRAAYYQVEADRHYTNEYAVLAGPTSKARKGTSYGRVLSVLKDIDPYWAEKCLVSGLGSGEALIEALGEDRRALVTEGEFARLLAVISREGTTISANLRNGWDTGNLSIRTRHDKLKVEDAHLSLIGHITRDELVSRLSSTEMGNGFANRILWVCTRRSKKLPHGGGEPNLTEIIRSIRDATEHTRKMGNTRVKLDDEAAKLWERVYDELSEGRPGMLGSITSRGEAHTIRLALNYALLDCAEKIRTEHLLAALTVWRYCFHSSRFIWGDALGDPTADELLRALHDAGDGGMTRWDVMNHFSRHKSAAELDHAIGVLAERGLIRSETEATVGRATTRYWAV